MRGTSAILTAISLALLPLLSPSAQPGQPLPAPPQAVLQQLVEESIQTIDSWEFHATLLILLTVMVGVFGVATGALQKYDNKTWCKVTTIGLGLAISTITVITQVVFPVDHRLLRQTVVEGRSLMTDIKWAMAQFEHTPPPEHQALYDEIFDKLKKLSTLEARIYRTAALPLEAVATAYAQTTAPAWVDTPPRSKIHLYFVGIGESRSLGQAKARSYEETTARAARYLRDHAKKPEEMSPEGLRAYVQKAGTVAQTSFTYDPTTQTYRYYTLFRLSRALAQPDTIRLFQ
jgi:hypothetical protein